MTKKVGSIGTTLTIWRYLTQNDFPRCGAGQRVTWREDFTTNGALTCPEFLEFSALRGDLVLFQLLNAQDAMSIATFERKRGNAHCNICSTTECRRGLKISQWIITRQLVWPPWQLDDDIFAFNIGLGKVLPSKDWNDHCQTHFQVFNFSRWG